MLPQLDPAWYASQSFWMLITFCTMFLVVWRFIIPSMRMTVDARRSRIESDMERTEKLKNEASRLIKELDEAQASLKMKTQAVFAQAQAETQALTKQLESDFNDRLSAHIAEKERELETVKKAALQDISRISGDLTQAIVHKVSNVSVSMEEINKMTASVMEKTV